MIYVACILSMFFGSLVTLLAIALCSAAKAGDQAAERCQP